MTACAEVISWLKKHKSMYKYVVLQPPSRNFCLLPESFVTSKQKLGSLLKYYLNINIMIYENSWKAVLNFMKICMSMKNTFLEYFIIFTNMKIFSFGKNIYNLKNSIHFDLKCLIIWTVYKILVRKKYVRIFYFLICLLPQCSIW